MIGPYPVIEDLTDYQDGIPGGSSSNNVSAGTFYTVTTSKGLVEKISSNVIWISPRQSFDTEQVVYDRSTTGYGESFRLLREHRTAAFLESAVSLQVPDPMDTGILFWNFSRDFSGFPDRIGMSTAF